MYRDFNGFFIYKTNREVSIVLCAVVKNLGSGQSTVEASPFVKYDSTDAFPRRA